MAQSAGQLYDEARAALAQQRTQEAARLLARALESCAADETELRLRIRISATWITFEHQGLDAALAEIDGVRDDSRASGLSSVQASATIQGGILLARGGDLAAAWRALAGVDETALPDGDRVRLLMNRGTMASEVQRFDEAVVDLAAAAELAPKLDLLPLAFMARHNLGWVQFLRGDLPAALAAMGQAEQIDVDIDRGMARLDRARVLLEAGLAQEALEVLDGVAGSGAQERAEADLEKARAELLLGRTTEAARHARQAARRFAARGEPFWERRCLLVALTARPGGAAATRLWAQADEAGDAWVAEHAAAIALERIRTPPPSALLRSARVLAASPVVSRRLVGQVALAERGAREGATVGARRRLRAVSTELLSAQLGVASLDLRAAVALHAQAAITLDFTLIERLPEHRRADALIDAAERWRAAARPLPRVRPDPDPDLAAAAARLRRARADSAGAPSDARLREAVVVAEGDLRSRSWANRSGSVAASETLTPARLRETARSRATTVVVCVPRGSAAWAVVLDGRSTRLVRLGDEEELGRLVQETHGDLAASAVLPTDHPLRAVVEGSLSARIDALCATLIEPLGLSTKPLLVVPSKVLTGVPWSALVEGPVSVSPTASSWATGGRVVADPVIAALAGPDLDGAARESGEVLDTWGAAPGPSTLAEALATCDLVHVAAHGTHRGDNPLFSSLQLDEGVVVAHELESAQIRASHVVLSACEVGRASHRPGDQPLGLTATLLAAGVACVVAPVAPVGDKVARIAMGRYHRGLVAGLDAATALAEATAGTPAAGAYVCFGSSWRAEPTGGAALR